MSLNRDYNSDHNRDHNRDLNRDHNRDRNKEHNKDHNRDHNNDNNRDDYNKEIRDRNRDKILNQADQMKMVFRELNKKNAVLKQDLEPYVEKIINYTDEVNGGFKGSPKFPQFYMFDTIFYFYKKKKDNK